MASGGTNKKVANGLLALSSAAVLAVYAAGYERTKAAADRFELQTAERRPAIPGPPVPAPAAAPTLAPSAALTPAPSTVSAPIAAKPAPIKKVVRAAPAPAAAASKAPEDPVVAPPQAPVAEPPVVVAEPPPVAAPVPPPAPAKPVYKDGTYLGWGTSRHGDIQAQVVIEGGRIKAATIAQCLTRYSCSWIENLPPQVAQRQSPETDYVSGATQSTNAFYYAVVEALSKAK